MSRLVPNTLRVECMADDVQLATSDHELAERLSEADARDVPVTLLGEGSNVVLRRRLPGIVVRPAIRGITAVRLDAQRWHLCAGAGESWHGLVRFAQGQGIGGLENLALIPGSVGAAPVQNIGAYGLELAEVLESVTVFDRRRGAFRTLGVDECGFRYRDSLFKADGGERLVVVRVAMVLGERPLRPCYADVGRELRRMGVGPSRVSIAEAVLRVRRRKLPDPRLVGNVGSFFKNPLIDARQLDAVRARLDVDAFAEGVDRFKVSAARLIDAAGWKGARQGDAQVWPRQPLVLVNRGRATAGDLLQLSERMRDDIAEKYGVGLQLEPAVKGVDGP